MDWIDGTDSAAAAFDFTTKAILQVVGRAVKTLASSRDEVAAVCITAWLHTSACHNPTRRSDMGDCGPAGTSCLMLGRLWSSHKPGEHQVPASCSPPGKLPLALLLGPCYTPPQKNMWLCRRRSSGRSTGACEMLMASHQVWALVLHGSQTSLALLPFSLTFPILLQAAEPAASASACMCHLALEKFSYSQRSSFVCPELHK